MGLENIAGTADRGAGTVAVLANAVASTGDDEGCTGGDVEGILLVAAGAHNVQGGFGAEIDVLARFKESVAKAQEFVYGGTAHLYRGEHSCDVNIGVLFTCDVEHQLVGLFARKGFARDELSEDVFHCYACELVVNVLIVEKPVSED